MAHITFIAHDGSTTEVEAELGSTLMQAAIDNSVDGIIAECGGCCSCATCHCYIDEAWLDRLSPPDDLEKEMIECALEPRPNSRLSCQVEISEALDGLVVHLPEAQY